MSRTTSVSALWDLGCVFPQKQQVKLFSKRIIKLCSVIYRLKDKALKMELSFASYKSQVSLSEQTKEHRTGKH